MSLGDSLAAKLREAAARGELPVSEDRIYSARPDATLEAFEQMRADAELEQMRADAELGAAWRECEAALPEGWRIEGIERSGTNVEFIGGRQEFIAWWDATARGPFDERERVHGPTLAAALRALAARLKEARP